MALSLATTTKSTEMLPTFHNSIPLRSHSALNRLFSSQNLSISLLKPFCSSSINSSIRTGQRNGRSNEHRTAGRGNHTSYKSRAPSAPWLNKWPSVEKEERGGGVDSEKREKNAVEDRVESRYFDGDKGRSAIERIVFRLRNMGIGSDDDEDDVGEEDVGVGIDGEDDAEMAYTGEEKLGDLLQRNWNRPDSVILEDEDDSMLLPWEREEKESVEEERRGLKKRPVKAPSLAELTLEDTELRRLRTMGMTLRERINIPKAGVTQVILEKIHDKWRKAELVRLKFHETLAHDMKKAHEIVEVGLFV